MKLISPFVITLCCTALSTSLLAADLSSSMDQRSYAIGYKTGQAMKARNMVINTATYNSGLQDGYQNKKPALSEKDMQTVLTAMQQEMMQKMQTQYKQLAEKNAADGKTFLDTNGKKSGS